MITLLVNPVRLFTRLRPKVDAKQKVSVDIDM